MGRGRYVQLTETLDWVPLARAKPAALIVYSEFSNNLGTMEDLSRLSYAIHRDFDPETKQVIDDELIERLTKRSYFTSSIGSLASRLTLRGRITANLVVADIDIEAKSFMGEAQEPFVDYPVLGTWYEAFMRNAETRRQRQEQAYEPLANSSV